MPSKEQLVHHYEKLSSPETSPHFNYAYEQDVIDFLKTYDLNHNPNSRKGNTEIDVFNRNFEVEEVVSAISFLKNNKSAGVDCIPAEFLKHNKETISQDMCDMYNYMLENEEFPDSWCEGIKSSIFKAGDRLNADNYRGITVLPIFEKVFEIIVQRRLEFVNEAFCRTDKYNGGFLKNSRTADNLFILQCLIERQLNLGQNLIVIFVDFTKAFDVMNRNILFYKIISSGLHGRLINTLRNLYTKTRFRVKHGGRLSDVIFQHMGVNQGGNASPTIFREYLSDLSKYMLQHTGVCISEMEILLHLLWADDLILVSTTLAGSENQLQGLSKCCSDNQAIVNLIKTKFMAFGNLGNIKLIFNGQEIERVSEYKYVGNIVQVVSKPTGDIFQNNYTYLCQKARNSVFRLLSNLRQIGKLPPACMLYLFKAMIQPILLYGSDVWGLNVKGGQSIDKILLWFLRIALNVKRTTSNLITLGECGMIPTSVFAQVNTISYYERLKTLPETSILKAVFNEQRRLHHLGFRTWYGRVWELARNYGLDLAQDLQKSHIQETLINSFKQKWASDINDISMHPLLRTYRLIKIDFKLEPYLSTVSNY